MVIDEEKWVPVDLHEELESLARCLWACELVGRGRIERYCPRSSRSCKDRSDEIEELAWKSYDKPVKNARLYIPSKHFKPDVTLRYLEWWKLPVSGGKDGNGSPESSEISVPNFKGTNLDYCPLFPPGFTPKCQCIEVLDSDEEDPTVEELLTPNKKLKIVDHGINGDGKTLPATAHSLLSFSAENNDVTTVNVAMQ